MLFGKQLRIEREKRNMSAQMLAETSDVSRSYITLIENGKRLPSRKVIPKIAAALKVKNNVIVNWYLEDMREKLL